MIIILPDSHFKLKKPFINAQQDFIKWFIGQDFNNSNNIMLSLGDFFDNFRPEPPVIDMALNFLQKCKFNKIYILRGNGQHEVDGIKKIFATDCLRSIKNVEIIEYFKQIDIENNKCFLMPAIPSNYFDENSWKVTLKKELEKVKDISFDFVFGHYNITDSRMWDFIDISELITSNNITMGHLHNQNLGVCVANTIAEKVIEKKIMIINNGIISHAVIPEFIQYKGITFPEKADLNEIEGTLYIIRCKDKQEAIEYYKDVYIHSVIVENDDNIFTLTDSVVEEKINLKIMFDLFCNENLIRDCVKDYIVGRIE